VRAENAKNGSEAEPKEVEHGGKVIADQILILLISKADGIMTRHRIESCTILTTTPNSLLADIHDRMPVILSPDNHDIWLDPAFQDTRSVSQMLRPFDSALMRRYPVSTRVNQVQNDDADCSEPLALEPSPVQTRLF
jgi:putative SOS response-associated peptidase YedK